MCVVKSFYLHSKTSLGHSKHNLCALLRFLENGIIFYLQVTPFFTRRKLIFFPEKKNKKGEWHCLYIDMFLKRADYLKTTLLHSFCSWVSDKARGNMFLNVCLFSGEWKRYRAKTEGTKCHAKTMMSTKEGKSTKQKHIFQITGFSLVGAWVGLSLVGDWVVCSMSVPL
jgi:hypothetical protein